MCPSAPLQWLAGRAMEVSCFPLCWPRSKGPQLGPAVPAGCSAASPWSDLPLGAGARLSSFGSAQSGPHSSLCVLVPREVGSSRRSRRLGRAALGTPVREAGGIAPALWGTLGAACGSV